MDFRRATSEIQNLKVRMDADEKNEDTQLESIKEIKKSLGLFLTSIANDFNGFCLCLPKLVTSR